MKLLIGAALIAAAIFGGLVLAPRMAPYRFARAGNGGAVYRLNAVTGEVLVCAQIIGCERMPGELPTVVESHPTAPSK